MNLQAPISTIMTADPLVLQMTDDLRKAKKLMLKHKIRHLPVMEGAQIVGIISKTDLNRLTFGTVYDADNDDEADAAVFDMLNIGQVMAANVQSVQHTQSIEEVARILAAHEFHALPVLDGKQVVGIVTTTDLIKYMLG
jgi:CBS domain-containing protein